MPESEIKRLPWERDEIILFLGYLGDDILKIKGKRKKERLSELSVLFQARGRQLEYELYESYRNLRSLENLFYTTKHYIETKSTLSHPLVIECVNLFQTNRAAFDAELESIPFYKTHEPIPSNNQQNVKNKVGNFGAHFKFSEILGNKRKIIQTLKKSYASISDFKLEKSEKLSWESTITTLQNAYKTLEPVFGDLDIIMEYVLPRFKPGTAKAVDEHSIRADVLLISEKTVLVLEFKQRDAKFESGFIKQAGKYQTRLARFHTASKKMIIKSILVLTKSENHITSFGTVASCSADKLADAIALMFEPNPKPYSNIEEWIKSDFQAE